MSLSSIAIDVGWFVLLDEADYDPHVKGVEFLNSCVRDRTHLLLDIEGTIIAEYERHLKPRTEGRRFFSQTMKLGQFTFLSGSPSHRCDEGLRAAQFDKDDDAYIGVAQRARAPFLACEEKHLKKDMRDAVLSECDVQIVELDDLLEM